MRRPTILFGLGAALLAVIAMTAAACGGGGGGGGTGPTGPPPPTTTIVFTPAGGGSVMLAGGTGTQGTTLSLEVRTTGIQDLYGLAFHLTYPVAALHFTGATEGSVLNAGGGVPTSFQIVDSPPGNLVVGLTRLGKVPGTAASGTLITLQLTAVASGTGNLAFSSNVASDSQGNVIPGVTWAGGAVQVTLVPGARR
jgi:hypothetical protein